MEVRNDLFLYDEMRDRSAAVLSGLVPPQRHALVVEVHNSGLSRLARRLCRGKYRILHISVGEIKNEKYCDTYYTEPRP